MVELLNLNHPSYLFWASQGNHENGDKSRKPIVFRKQNSRSSGEIEEPCFFFSGSDREREIEAFPTFTDSNSHPTKLENQLYKFSIQIQTRLHGPKYAEVEIHTEMT